MCEQFSCCVVYIEPCLFGRWNILIHNDDQAWPDALISCPLVALRCPLKEFDKLRLCRSNLQLVYDEIVVGGKTNFGLVVV